MMLSSTSSAAEILVVLRKLVRGLLQRVHDHFRAHVAEQQVLAVVRHLHHSS